LKDQLDFPGITDCIETVLNRFESEASFAKPLETIDNVLSVDGNARAYARNVVAGKI